MFTLKNIMCPILTLETTSALIYTVKLIWFSVDHRIKISLQHNLIENYPEIAVWVVLNCYHLQLLVKIFQYLQ